MQFVTTTKINNAPAVTFLWVHTFPLKVGPLQSPSFALVPLARGVALPLRARAGRACCTAEQPSAGRHIKALPVPGPPCAACSRTRICSAPRPPTSPLRSSPRPPHSPVPPPPRPPSRPQIYGPLVLPLIIVFIITSIETVGDVTATEEASFISTTGPGHERRIRGALTNDSMSSIFSSLVSDRAGKAPTSVGRTCLRAQD